MSEHDAYIAKMIARGHTSKAAESYWDAKSGNNAVVLDDNDGSIGGAFGGQAMKARDPTYSGISSIDDVVPIKKRRAEPRTIRIIDEETDRMIDVFKATGVPVVRKAGDHRRFEVTE